MPPEPPDDHAADEAIEAGKIAQEIIDLARVVLRRYPNLTAPQSAMILRDVRDGLEESMSKGAPW